MRILAIRGENLASLEAPFDIDFTAEPLESAGIFAITGPTGAGKSTLLDAMGLALFDTMARLGPTSSGAKITGTGDELSANDVRAIMRHGAKSCFAEVDFEVRGTRWRARWSVDRARTGTLKQRERSLINLDTGEGGPDKLTIIKEKTEKLIGLTPDQFGRAVVLAQGEFEKFLNANDSERAELLETLTGTDIYSRVGRLAGQKANELKQEERGILEQIRALDGLNDVERAELEAEGAGAAAELLAAQQALETLQEAQRWEQVGTSRDSGARGSGPGRSAAGRLGGGKAGSTIGTVLARDAAGHATSAGSERSDRSCRSQTGGTVTCLGKRGHGGCRGYSSLGTDSGRSRSHAPRDRQGSRTG